VIRIHYSLDESYGGCIDLPDSCSVGSAIRNHLGRGYVRVIGLTFSDGRIRLLNEAGVLCIIEDITVTGEALPIDLDDEAVNV
jgi:hypothetical protein